mgnify:FL=1
MIPNTSTGIASHAGSGMMNLLTIVYVAYIKRPICRGETFLVILARLRSFLPRIVHHYLTPAALELTRKAQPRIRIHSNFCGLQSPSFPQGGILYTLIKSGYPQFQPYLVNPFLTLDSLGPLAPALSLHTLSHF